MGLELCQWAEWKKKSLTRPHKQANLLASQLRNRLPEIKARVYDKSLKPMVVMKRCSSHRFDKVNGMPLFSIQVICRVDPVVMSR
jgi:hypothetical protein